MASSSSGPTPHNEVPISDTDKITVIDFIKKEVHPYYDEGLLTERRFVITVHKAEREFFARHYSNGHLEPGWEAIVQQIVLHCLAVQNKLIQRVKGHAEIMNEASPTLSDGSPGMGAVVATQSSPSQLAAQLESIRKECSALQQGIAHEKMLRQQLEIEKAEWTKPQAAENAAMLVDLQNQIKALRQEMKAKETQIAVCNTEKVEIESELDYLRDRVAWIPPVEPGSETAKQQQHRKLQQAHQQHDIQTADMVGRTGSVSSVPSVPNSSAIRSNSLRRSDSQHSLQRQPSMRPVPSFRQSPSQQPQTVEWIPPSHSNSFHSSNRNDSPAPLAPTQYNFNTPPQHPQPPPLLPPQYPQHQQHFDQQQLPDSHHTLSPPPVSPPPPTTQQQATPLYFNQQQEGPVHTTQPHTMQHTPPTPAPPPPPLVPTTPGVATQPSFAPTSQPLNNTTVPTAAYGDVGVNYYGGNEVAPIQSQYQGYTTPPPPPPGPHPYSHPSTATPPMQPQQQQQQQQQAYPSTPESYPKGVPYTSTHSVPNTSGISGIRPIPPPRGQAPFTSPHVDIAVALDAFSSPQGVATPPAVPLRTLRHGETPPQPPPHTRTHRPFDPEGDPVRQDQPIGIADSSHHPEGAEGYYRSNSPHFVAEVPSQQQQQLLEPPITEFISDIPTEVYYPDATHHEVDEVHQVEELQLIHNNSSSSTSFLFPADRRDTPSPTHQKSSTPDPAGLMNLIDRFASENRALQEYVQEAQQLLQHASPVGKPPLASSAAATPTTSGTTTTSASSTAATPPRSSSRERGRDRERGTKHRKSTRHKSRTPTSSYGSSATGSVSSSLSSDEQSLSSSSSSSASSENSRERKRHHHRQHGSKHTPHTHKSRHSRRSRSKQRSTHHHNRSGSDSKYHKPSSTRKHNRGTSPDYAHVKPHRRAPSLPDTTTHTDTKTPSVGGFRPYRRPYDILPSREDAPKPVWQEHSTLDGSDEHDEILLKQQRQSELIVAGLGLTVDDVEIITGDRNPPYDTSRRQQHVVEDLSDSTPEPAVGMTDPVNTSNTTDPSHSHSSPSHQPVTTTTSSATSSSRSSSNDKSNSPCPSTNTSQLLLTNNTTTPTPASGGSGGSGGGVGPLVDVTGEHTQQAALFHLQEAHKMLQQAIDPDKVTTPTTGDSREMHNKSDNGTEHHHPSHLHEDRQQMTPSSSPPPMISMSSLSPITPAAPVQHRSPHHASSSGDTSIAVDPPPITRNTNVHSNVHVLAPLPASPSPPVPVRKHVTVEHPEPDIFEPPSRLLDCIDDAIRDATSQIDAIEKMINEDIEHDKFRRTYYCPQKTALTPVSLINGGLTPPNNNNVHNPLTLSDHPPHTQHPQIHTTVSIPHFQQQQPIHQAAIMPPPPLTTAKPPIRILPPVAQGAVTVSRSDRENHAPLRHLEDQLDAVINHNRQPCTPPSDNSATLQELELQLDAALLGPIADDDTKQAERKLDEFVAGTTNITNSGRNNGKDKHSGHYHHDPIALFPDNPPTFDDLANEMNHLQKMLGAYTKPQKTVLPDNKGTGDSTSRWHNAEPTNIPIFHRPTAATEKGDCTGHLLEMEDALRQFKKHMEVDEHNVPVVPTTLVEVGLGADRNQWMKKLQSQIDCCEELRSRETENTEWMAQMNVNSEPPTNVGRNL